MVNHKKNKNGFSLIEMVTVIGILGIILIVSFTSLGSSREKISMGEAQASLLYALQEAQNRSSTGYGTEASSHGVRVANDGFSPIVVKADGTTIEGIKIDLPTGILTNQVDTNIIFNRLKSTIDSEVNINIIQNAVVKKTITVKTNGKISVE